MYIMFCGESVEITPELKPQTIECFTFFQKSSVATPGKKRSSPAKQELQPPLVVIFKDLEAFNPRVLQDFILICR